MPSRRKETSKHFVGFLVGEVTYAVRIEAVRQIVNPLPIIDLPRMGDAVKGVAEYRGEVVPVVSLRERFGFASADVTRKTKWIIVDASHAPRSSDEVTKPVSHPQRRFVALAVDAVTEVFGTSDGSTRNAPSLGVGSDAHGFEGVASHAGILVFVLDVRVFYSLAAVAIARASELPPRHGATSEKRT